jgi:hypothetical protein
MESVGFEFEVLQANAAVYTACLLDFNEIYSWV